ncbi:MAG: histidine phosphatase family protein [Melioribacteraceae bacterium]|nr:histidine phosphatase family protein [Melioribacteraceae bacterium]
MKYLYLIRHAKSSWDDSSLSDHERPLNNRGLRNATFMSNLIKDKNIMPDLIISSTAERAVQTAKIFSNSLQHLNPIKFDSRIYEATTQNLLEVVSEIENHFNIVFMFGHNPGLTNFANFISNQPIYSLPTCAIVGFELQIDNWNKISRHTANLILNEYPKKYS